MLKDCYVFRQLQPKRRSSQFEYILSVGITYAILALYYVRGEDLKYDLKG